MSGEGSPEQQNGIELSMGCGICGTGSGPEHCDHVTYMPSDEFYALLAELGDVRGEHQ